MSQNRYEPNEAGDHIWERYATQFTKGGRSYTIEIGIPFPLGASAETREQLLREADAGMTQLAAHVENRVAQILQPVQPTHGAISTSAPAVKPSMTPPQPPPKPMNRPNPSPAAQTTVQPMPTRPVSANAREEVVEQASSKEDALPLPPNRSPVGATMPIDPAASSEAGSNITIPQFISIINELGLGSRQAMDLLKVKSLSGINLWDALRQLQYILAQDPNSSAKAAANQKPPGSGSAKLEEKNPAIAPTNPAMSAVNRSTSAPLPGKPAPREENRQAIPSVREERPVYKNVPNTFIEEIDLDAEEDDELEDLDLPHELTAQERIKAKNIISRLRESRGATAASSARLQVLDNIAGSQVSEEELLEVIEGAWDVSALKKLKVDQVEALISWAKEDDFVNELDAVRMLLEEEKYARGNR
jgi:hypothetical protein